jgi:hypothetical protein
VDFWVYLSHAFGKEAGFLLACSRFKAGMRIQKEKFAAYYDSLQAGINPLLI